MAQEKQNKLAKVAKDTGNFIVGTVTAPAEVVVKGVKKVVGFVTESGRKTTDKIKSIGKKEKDTAVEVVEAQ